MENFIYCLGADSDCLLSAVSKRDSKNNSIFPIDHDHLQKKAIQKGIPKKGILKKGILKKRLKKGLLKKGFLKKQ